MDLNKRMLLASIAAGLVAVAGPALAQKKYDTGASDTEIKVGNINPYSGPASAYGTIGKTIGGSGFHTPSYVAMERNFFKEEGLDASFITLQGRALVTAGLAGQVDLIPIPSGGAQAALSGAEIRYVVGQSLKSQWLIAARPEIAKPEDLRGKTVGYGRAGSADYDEGAAVLRRAFKMEVGKDYKVISFQGETTFTDGNAAKKARSAAS